MGVFLICVGPILIIALIMYVERKMIISPTAAFIAYIFSLSHSAINPCIYGLFDIRFR